ncbi:hypothetical protein D3C71_1955190 [compost metagenome]
MNADVFIEADEVFFIVHVRSPLFVKCSYWALASLSCSSAKAMNTCRSSASRLIRAMKAEKARLAASRRRSDAQAGR